MFFMTDFAETELILSRATAEMKANYMPIFQILPVANGGTGSDNPKDSRKNLGIPEIVGAAGQVYYLQKANDTTVSPGYLLLQGKFVSGETDLNAEKNRPQDMSTVFNQFEKFALDLSADPSTYWNYDETKKTIVCVVNAGYTGFLSPTKHDNYMHDCTISSTNGDNDANTVILAACRDADGALHTLDAVRTCALHGDVHVYPAGVDTQWAICKDYRQGTTKMIANGMDSIPNPVASGWSTQGATRMQVIRHGDIISATISQYGSTELDPNTTLTIDLGNDPDLEMFRGPQSYGYGSNSQPSSFFQNVVFSDTTTSIIDLSKNQVWVYNGSEWSIDTNQTLESLQCTGKLCYNPYLKKLYFVQDVGLVLPIVL